MSTMDHPNPAETPMGEPSPRADDVCGVIVSYRPELPLLQAVVDSVAGQVGRLILHDNASGSDEYDRYLAQVEDRRIEVVRSTVNLGLGEAINRAAARARAGGFACLLILDQDSVLDPGAVAILRGALEHLHRTRRAAAVGACFRDARTGAPAPFVRIGFPFNRKLYGGAGETVECDFLISSGCLIALDALDEIGGMDEGLFIDNVDLEWSFRARHRGYRLFGVCAAGMRHRIGDRLRRVPGLRHPVILHGPLRLYYMMRNRVLLYRRAETPGAWIAQDVPRLLLKLVGMGCFVPPRRENLRWMLRGLFDGLRGRTGRMPD